MKKKNKKKNQIAKEKKKVKKEENKTGNDLSMSGGEKKIQNREKRQVSFSCYQQSTQLRQRFQFHKRQVFLITF